MNKPEILRQLQTLGVISHEKLTLRSGEVSDYYCDMRKVFSDPEVFTALAEQVKVLLPPTTTCIAASGYGGLPLGAVIATLGKFPFVGVRGEAKDHGRSGRLAGYTPSEIDNVVIVDDVLTSGSSIRETAEGLQSTSATIVGAVVLVRRNDVAFPFPIEAVFEIRELLE
jgi:orotate phosphoribosyltransferase